MTVAAKKEELLTIGQLLKALSEKHKGIAASKIRFLEINGLISPKRTASGYRKYSASDIERIEMILHMQQKYYYPLKVIKQYLDDLDNGVINFLPGFKGFGPKKEKVYSKNTLLASANADEALFKEAASANLINNKNSYTQADISVLASCAKLKQFGITPNHLRGLASVSAKYEGLIEMALSQNKKNSITNAAIKKDLHKEFINIFNKLFLAQ